jgi:hypothetical protein
MPTELTDQAKDRLKGRREDLTRKYEESLDMAERQVSAHYTYDDIRGNDEAETLQDDFGVTTQEADRAVRKSLEQACRKRFEEEHDLSFRTNYVSVEKEKHGRWSCTIMTNQT